MLKKTEGIVLKTTPLSEADLIATFFTYDFGVINAYVKSPRKIGSRFGSSLEPLTYSRIALWGKENAKLLRLTQADIIYSFQSIRDRLKCFLKAAELLELTLNFLPEHEINKKIFAVLINILNEMDKDCFGALCLLQYKIKFLGLLGYAPRLHECARCGTPGNRFYLSECSVICGRCRQEAEAPIELSMGTISLYRNLAQWAPSKINRIKPSSSSLLELIKVIDNHIEQLLLKPLNAKKFSRLTME